MQLSTSFLAQVTPVEPSPVQAALTQLFPADNFVLLGVILALPLIGAFVNGVFGKRLGREAVTLMALSAVGLSFVASLVAYFLGEFTNSYLLARLKVMTGGRWLWLRTIGSTLAGQAIDTTVFMLIATGLGVFPAELLLSLIVTNYILKVGIEVLLTPLTYRIVNALKSAEHEDYFDRATDFNPFKISV